MPAALLDFFLLGRYRDPRRAKAWLLAVSLASGALANPRQIALLTASVALNLLAGDFLAREGVPEPRRRRVLTFGVAANVAALAISKYAVYAIDNLNTLLGSALAAPKLGFPPGISFLTFLQIALLVDRFLLFQLGSDMTGIYYRAWRRPVDLAARLEEVDRYARKHGITLRFAIPPAHVDLQAEPAAYGLGDEFEEYRCELAKRADVVDFDFLSPLTNDAENFKDPYHLNDTRTREVVADFAAGSRRWSRHCGPSALPTHCEAKAGASFPPSAGASGPP